MNTIYTDGAGRGTFEKWAAPVLTGIVAFVIYIFTNVREIYWGDAGEFTAAAATLGIGHPYGHPLFWLLGRVSIMLIPAHPAAAMSFLTALTGAGTAAVAALMAREWLPEKISTTAGIVSALCAGASRVEAGLIGNLVASVTIQQLGTTGAATPDQVIERHAVVI